MIEKRILYQKNIFFVSGTLFLNSYCAAFRIAISKRIIEPLSNKEFMRKNYKSNIKEDLEVKELKAIRERVQYLIAEECKKGR